MTRTSDPSASTDEAYLDYRARRSRFWDQVWMGPGKRTASRYYNSRLTKVYRFLVPPGQRVLELGCGQGDLLAALEPSQGVGIDFSTAALRGARQRHPELEFIEGDVHEIELAAGFDVVIISELVNDAWDVQRLMEQAARVCTPETRVVMNFFNRLWQVPIGLTRRVGLAKPLLKQNWLSVSDVSNVLRLAGFEVISTSGEVLWPLRFPVVDALLNRFLVRVWPFNHLAMTHFIVARPSPQPFGSSVGPDATVSVVVPARNEAGHIREILDRVPTMGSATELIFVEGNSTDDTYEVIQREVDALNDPSIRYFRQPGKGKGDAVRTGFEHASGDILMILDADMTVAPEDLPRFFKAISDGTGEFVNGVRLVYPMEEEAMQFLNLLGNKLFGIAFTWLLRQPVKDTLCGTKVLTRKSYDAIADNRAYFGDFDPFGDFDLLFGAAKNNLKIIDLPVRYRQRRYGATNIDRWRHGALLLRMTAFAARKIKFV